MKRTMWIAGLTVGAALALTGCSGGPTEVLGEQIGTAEAGDGGAVEGNAEGAGSIDCSAIDSETVGQYSVFVQLFAQLTDVEQLNSFETLGYTPEKFDTALDQLEAVRAAGTSQFGDPGEALDFYRELNDTVGELVAKGDAVTQADVDAYAAQSGGVTNVLAKQLAINYQLSEACPDIG